MLLICIIDSKEEKDVAVIDIPNAFIQKRIKNKKDMDIIKICGILVDMLLDISPYVYGLYVTMDRKAIKQFINQCMNAIYGTMVASILYYQNFKTLKLNKFKINTYDPCVTNKLVNGLQQSILYHIDYCRLSYKDTKVNDSFIGLLREGYHIIF